MLGEGFTKWDYTGLALHFYNKYQYDSDAEQLQVFHDTVNKIVREIVEKEHEKGRLNQTGMWLWCSLKSGKEWPLSKWITVNTKSPYAKAAKLIRNL